MESICLIEGPKRTTFARVPVCTSCSRLIGDPKPLYGCPIRPLEAKGWEVSWAAMGEQRRQRIGCPLNFELRNGFYVPEGYEGEWKFQPDREEPPF
jgi:hypothetical protein